MNRKEQLVMELLTPVEEMELTADQEPLSEYGKVWLKWFRQNCPLEAEEAELNGQLDRLVRTKDQEGLELEMSILESLRDDLEEPADYLERVQWRNGLVMQARELAMSSLIPNS